MQCAMGHFISGGGSKTIDVGFVPDYLRIWNLGSGANEVVIHEYFSELGDGKSVATKQLADNGSTSGKTVEYLSSGAPISAHNANAISTVNPITVSGGKGFTIDTAWLDDSDVIYYMAIQADRNIDHGDESP